MSVDQIPRRKLYHEVLARLHQRIRSGELAPGDHLPSERELMAFYGVGRPAVREALQALARDGIVEISHGERARVVLPTAQLLVAQIAGGAQHLLRLQPAMLEHMKEARVFPGMRHGPHVRRAGNAGRRGAPFAGACANTHAALAQMDQFLDRDMAFHREIATISGNPIFPAVVEALFTWASEYYRSIVRAPGVEHLTLAEHQRIIDAIARHDSEGAERAMRDHLTRANALYKRIETPPDAEVR